MKKTLLYTALVAFAGLTLASCSEDSLSSTSVIAPTTTEPNAFDKWITANYVTPYNIEFKYRYEDNETDMAYYNVPADSASAVKLAHIVKYACLDAYEKVAGADFLRSYFPKMLYTVGDFEYKNNGTMILGTAEGGKKIFLAGTNYLDRFIGDRDALNTYYLKTIHHEFTHILNQTKDYTVDFKLITAKDYVTDSWSNTTYGDPSYYLTHGFITAYSQHSHQEDFAEMLSTYVCNPQTQWDSWLTQAGTDGAKKINQKLEIVKNYMKTEWNIDLDKLRDEVLSREDSVVAGSVDLESLTVQ